MNSNDWIQMTRPSACRAWRQTDQPPRAAVSGDEGTAREIHCIVTPDAADSPAGRPAHL